MFPITSGDPKKKKDMPPNPAKAKGKDVAVKVDIIKKPKDVPTLDPLVAMTDAIRKPANSGKKVSQASVAYLGPDAGPFQCDNCAHWQGGKCEVVAGTIDPAGCCNIFEPAQHDEVAEPLAEESTETPEEESTEPGA